MTHLTDRVARVRLAVALLAAFALTGCASTSPSTNADATAPRSEPSSSQPQKIRTHSQCSDVTQQVVDRINAHRRKRDLSLLSCDDALGRAAAIHSEDLCVHDRFSHTGSDGSTMVDRARRVGLSFRTLGENIARGQQSAREVVSEWMNSPPHRKNILNDEFDRIGVARTRCPNAPPVWVQVFTGN